MSHALPGDTSLDGACTQADRRPWLSVLLPVYNVEAYLAECLESVLGQASLDGVEVVALDDKSTDGSRAILERAAAEHRGRFRVVSHERNRGLSGARNSLLAACRGEFVWFLDSDDRLAPGAIGQLRKALDASGADLVVCDYAIIPHDPERAAQRRPGDLHRRAMAMAAGVPQTSKPAVLQGLFEADRMYAWNKIGRRELYAHDLRFPEGVCFEDMFVSPELLYRARCVFYADQPWVQYRERPTSISRSADPRFLHDRVSALTSVLAWQHERLNGAAQASPPLARAVGHVLARNFVDVCRRSRDMQRRGTPVPARELLQRLEASTPAGMGAVVAAYVHAGWLWRALRLAYWLHWARRH